MFTYVWMIIRLFFSYFSRLFAFVYGPVSHQIMNKLKHKTVITHVFQKIAIYSSLVEKASFLMIAFSRI